ncbi:flagellin, partial [Gammaproteobacteria bacterium]|nr:flagellin [Gammaproteobacteria bacterium]MDC0196565.1 flagellin [Gammaproteobacteria bacterium]
PANLKVSFSEDGSSTLTVSGISSDSSGLSVVTATTNWVADADIENAINDLDSALSTLRSSAATMGSNAAVLSLRLDFTTNLINSLEGGAAKLVNADLNDESANLLTLQTRQQLGTIGLSIAQQSEQSILRLF